ncbi:MAG: Transcriptional regulator, TetR family [Frankiales bacterium]|nr:Transcriptional regulator, TetR family [Frankiales bacterium]
MAAPRRTQEERSAATRSRLLEATIECLVDYGYAGTTVARVAERAQVTRGAQVHHFPTKENLVISAVLHLNELRSREIVAMIAPLEGSPELVDRLLERLWESHRGPLFVATAEMWIAARTNSQLAEHVTEVEAAVNVAFHGSRTMSSDFRDAVFTSMDAMRGLVLSSWHLSEKDQQARWKRLKRQLEPLFPQ